MICELIPKEFLIVPYKDAHFFNGSSSKTDFFNGRCETFSYDSKVFTDLQNCRNILIEYFGNKKLENLIPKDIIEFYISKIIKNEDTKVFYQVHRDIIKQHLKLYQDKLYILPDTHVTLRTNITNPNYSKLTFKDTFIPIEYINTIVDELQKARYNKIIIGVRDDSTSVWNAYIIDVEYILNNIPDCVCCKQHKFKIHTSSFGKSIQCQSCGFEIPDLKKFLYCTYIGQKIIEYDK